MIRINLLGRPRPKVKRRVAIAGTLQVVLFLVPLAVAVILLFVHYTLIQRQIASLDKEITQKRAELNALNVLKKQVEEFEKEQQRLAARRDIIEQLQRNQQGPVRMLEAVGNTVTLTETLWLTSMEQGGDNVIQFKGLAGSVNAVANFITNLMSSGYFQNVEIKETVEKPQREGQTSFEFTLSAKFVLPAPPAAPPAAGGGM